LSVNSDEIRRRADEPRSNAAALTQVFCIVGANFAGYTKRATASSMVIVRYLARIRVSVRS
jgi:hypothetical protein